MPTFQSVIEQNSAGGPSGATATTSSTSSGESRSHQCGCHQTAQGGSEQPTEGIATMNPVDSLVTTTGMPREDLQLLADLLTAVVLAATLYYSVQGAT